MTTKPTYRLPAPDGGFFYRDEKQLRRSFRPWVRWLPCWVLWKMAVWWYSHSGSESKKQQGGKC